MQEQRLFGASRWRDGGFWFRQVQLRAMSKRRLLFRLAGVNPELPE